MYIPQTISNLFNCITSAPSFRPFFECFSPFAETAIAKIEDAAETLKDSTRFVGDVTNLDFKKAVSDAKEILDDGREILVDAGVAASQMDSAVKSTDLAFQVVSDAKKILDDGREILVDAGVDASQIEAAANTAEISFEISLTPDINVISGVIGNTALAPKNLQAPSDAHEVLNNAEISETTVSSVENTFVPAEEAVVIETIGQYATPEATSIVEQDSKLAQNPQDDVSSDNAEDIPNEGMIISQPNPIGISDPISAPETIQEYEIHNADGIMPDPIEESGSNDASTAVPTEPTQVEYTEPEPTQVEYTDPEPTPVTAEYTEPEQVATTTPEPTPLAGESAEMHVEDVG